jgi:hypothetical protein
LAAWKKAKRWQVPIIARTPIFGDRLMRRLCVLTVNLLTLAACAEYRPSEAECFNSFAEVSRSNCNFELLGPIGNLSE